MRILFCNYEYPPLGGGGGVATAILARELAKRHEVTVLTSHGLGLPLHSVEDGVHVERVPVRFRRQQAAANLLSLLAFVPLGIRAGQALLATHRFDVINTHFVLPSGPVGDALARRGAIPNVLSLHGGDLYDPSKLLSPHRHPLLRVWIRRLLRRADLVVGQSSNTLDNLRRFYAPELAGVRIPLAIGRPAAGVAARADYGLGDDEALLITVGRLVARKAVDQLVAMMEAFEDKKVRLLVVGSGPRERPLKTEAARRQLSEKILFLGYVAEDEKARLLRMSDVYVSTSQHEGFGLVFLEAMACGLPVVCYDHGGQTDFLCDGETGFVVPLNDLALFTRQVALLLGEPQLRRALGAHNARRAEDFSGEKCALEYERVFAAAIDGQAKRAAAGSPGSPAA